jgi:DNA-directed RNA polymerase alpha subunit
MSGPTVAELVAASGLAADAGMVTLPGLTWHVTRPLKQAGIATVGELASRTDEQLLDVPSFGERRLAALKAALTEVTW